MYLFTPMKHPRERDLPFVFQFLIFGYDTPDKGKIKTGRLEDHDIGSWTPVQIQTIRDSYKYSYIIIYPEFE